MTDHLYSPLINLSIFVYLIFQQVTLELKQLYVLGKFSYGDDVFTVLFNLSQVFV